MSKETEDNSIMKAAHEIHNKAIDDAIEVVKEYNVETWKLLHPHNHLLNPFDYIISKLNNLKK